mmetsp:Transcript_29666/g.72842  ORF Transcript_29666/g.72842 Transcript_29666/m.72842 type:complete len:245 (-) Transcript_29666:54-788(-)
MEQLDEPAFGVCLLEAVQRSLQRELSLGEHRRVALALGVVLSAWWHDEIERLLEGDERHADLLHLSPFLICGHVARVDHDHQAGECLGVHAFDGIEDAADLVEARLFLERGRSEPERRRVSLFPCHSRVNQHPVTPRLAVEHPGGFPGPSLISARDPGLLLDCGGNLLRRARRVLEAKLQLASEGPWDVQGWRRRPCGATAAAATSAAGPAALTSRDGTSPAVAALNAQLVAHVALRAGSVGVV